MAECLMVTGVEITKEDKAHWPFIMEPIIKVSLEMVFLMERDKWYIIMVTSIRGNSDLAKKKAVEYCTILTSLFMMENGWMIMPMDMVSLLIKMVMNMKVSLSKDLNKDRESIHFKMVVFMMENGSWIVELDMV